MEQAPKARHGHSRDQRTDCRQVIIAVGLSAEGFPLAYEIMPGNTSDKTTLRHFLQKIETQYGKANRLWILDRGIPTEEVLSEMRASIPPVSYLVGAPRAGLETLSGILMLDVHLPLADGRELVLPRYTQPEPEQRLVLEKLGGELPVQPPPRIRSAQPVAAAKARERK